MQLGLFQVSGGGLELDPLAAPDALVLECDLDTTCRRGADASPISTHE